MTLKTDSIVNDYMKQLERQLSGLPPDVAGDVESQIREHIATALSAISSPTESDVRNVLAQVGSPQSIAAAAKADFPSTGPAHRVSLRSLSWWAYTLWFGSIWGYAAFGYTTKHPDGSTDDGLIFVWVTMALIGQALVWFKNQRIADRHLRSRVIWGDLGVAVAALALIAILPSYIGLVKALVVVLLFGFYYYKTWRIYQDPTA